MKRLLMPCDDIDYDYVGADADTVWSYDTCPSACTSCGKSCEEMYINQEKEEWLCDDCVLIVTQTELVAAWKALYWKLLAGGGE